MALAKNAPIFTALYMAIFLFVAVSMSSIVLSEISEAQAETASFVDQQ
jgi:hypothetical protein